MRIINVAVFAFMSIKSITTSMQSASLTTALRLFFTINLNCSVIPFHSVVGGNFLASEGFFRLHDLPGGDLVPFFFEIFDEVTKTIVKKCHQLFPSVTGRIFGERL